MDSDEVDVPALAVAIGEAVDAELRRRPGVTAFHVCEALGAVGGAVVGRSAPSGDDAHFCALVAAYAAILAAARSAAVK